MPRDRRMAFTCGRLRRARLGPDSVLISQADLLHEGVVACKHSRVTDFPSLKYNLSCRISTEIPRDNRDHSHLTVSAPLSNWYVAQKAELDMCMMHFERLF